MALAGIKNVCNNGSFTDYCLKPMPAHGINGKDWTVVNGYRIVGENKRVLICVDCKKPPRFMKYYIKFCGWCEHYYRERPEILLSDPKIPESENCTECEDVL